MMYLTVGADNEDPLRYSTIAFVPVCDFSHTPAKWHLRQAADTEPRLLACSSLTITGFVPPYLISLTHITVNPVRCHAPGMEPPPALQRASIFTLARLARRASRLGEMMSQGRSPAFSIDIFVPPWKACWLIGRSGENFSGGGGASTGRWTWD